MAEVACLCFRRTVSNRLPPNEASIGACANSHFEKLPQEGEVNKLKKILLDSTQLETRQRHSLLQK